MAPDYQGKAGNDKEQKIFPMLVTNLEHLTVSRNFPVFLFSKGDLLYAGHTTWLVGSFFFLFFSVQVVLGNYYLAKGTSPWESLTSDTARPGIPAA